MAGVRRLSTASASATVVWPLGKTEGYAGAGNALSRCSAIGNESCIAPCGLNLIEAL